MSIKPASAVPPLHGDTHWPWADWATLYATSVMQTQRLQAESMLSWQAAMMKIGNEFWDEWRCRFAGGAPIDV